ncbi:MAG: glycosyltransferase family 4 protein [Rhodanobacteraceae bacterium]|jgi:glycosyltransferase involved in cell wall biosynthesis|nr:MAG: glycosyltransferase family 4 protein [Rhodanobacteraceae bacterium]
MPKVVLFANTDWYLFNFRRSLALALQDEGYDVLLLSPAGDYGPRLRALGLRWLPLQMDRRSVNPLRETALLLRVAALLRHERPALLHNFTIKSAVYGSLAARMAGVPARINAVDGLGYVFASNDRKARILRPAVRTLLRSALRGRNTRLILQNPDDKAAFEQFRLIESSRVRLIPGAGVDCTRFTPRAARNDGADTQPARVLLAARLLWEKGIAEYAQAARILRAQGRNVRFLLAGTPDPGNPAAVPEATLREWVEEGVLEWLGHVGDMRELYASVDIVTLPSYYREGIPTSLTEAAACGLPLITTDMPGCREVVTDGKDGLLIPPRDAEALAAAIARLLDSPGLAARLGNAARAKALDVFDEQIIIRRTLDVYRRLLPRTRRLRAAASA